MKPSPWRGPLILGVLVLLCGLALCALLIPADAGQTLACARLQTALSMAWHIAIACFGTGMPLLLLFAQRRGLSEVVRLWEHLFAVLFAAGAVSGTVLSFTLGMLWPGLFAGFGDVFGIPFAFEGLAFFTEAVALGFLLYGRGRISPALHRAAGVVLALSGLASAVFVVCAHGWMNAPTGFRLENGVPVDVQPTEVLLNAAALPEATHMLLAALLVSAWALAGGHALALLRRPQSTLHQAALRLALACALLFTPLQLLAGDLLTRFVAQSEPVKFAALEALEHSGPHAPFSLGGVFIDGELHGAIEIPSGLSLLLHGRADAEVRGLDAVPAADLPPVGAVHTAFQLMVLCGMWLMLVTLLDVRRRWTRRGFSRAHLRCILLCAPAALIATEAGWVATELGRQPWVVRGFLRTADAVTQQQALVPGLVLVILVFAALSAALCRALNAVVQHAESTP